MFALSLMFTIAYITSSFLKCTYIGIVTRYVVHIKVSTYLVISVRGLVYLVYDKVNRKSDVRCWTQNNFKISSIVYVSRLLLVVV